MSWNNFAPRLGAIYRLNEKTVFRTGYGLTYNAHAVGARGARRQRLPDHDRRRASRTSMRSASTARSQQGIPTIVAPDQSTGRVPLDRAAAEYTPEIDNIDRGYVQTWNIAFERRLHVRHVGGRRLRRRQGHRRLRRARHQRADRRSAAATRAVRMLRLGRIIAINSWGDRLKTNYQSLQVALNKPFTHGLLFKGAYTLSKSMNQSDNDGRATLTWNTPSELYRN